MKIEIVVSNEGLKIIQTMQDLLLKAYGVKIKDLINAVDDLVLLDEEHFKKINSNQETPKLKVAND